MNPWTMDYGWRAGHDPHDTVLDLELRLDPASAAAPAWAALARSQGEPTDAGTVSVGGAFARPTGTGMLLCSGGEDAVDSLADLADTVVDACADAGIEADAQWVQHPPRREP